MGKFYGLNWSALVLICLPLIAQTPDNTATNKRDRTKMEVTADQQSNRKTAVQISREIRKSLIADKSLSSYAHNVKIITANGEVTLKGPVRSEEEKAAVFAKAKEVAGAASVKNELSVVPTKRKLKSGLKPSEKKSQTQS